MFAETLHRTLRSIFGLLTIIIAISSQNDRELFLNREQICLQDKHCPDGGKCMKPKDEILG